VRTLRDHIGALIGVAFSPDGMSLASASAHNTVTLWDVGGQELRTLRATMLRTHRGKKFLDGIDPWEADWDLTVELWCGAGGQEPRTLGHSGLIKSFAFSPDSKRSALASGDTVLLLEVGGGRGRRTLKGHLGLVHSVAFSPDGARLASASEDTTVKLWDAVGGYELRTLKGHTGPVLSVAFSPDGTRLASAGEDGSIRIYDARPLTPVLRVEREAVGLVDALFSRHVLQADVLEALRQYRAITEPVRASALVFAEKRRDDPKVLNKASWSIVRQPGTPVERCRQAVRWAEAACRLQPENESYLNTLGVAQYRTGKYAEALATLTRSEPLNAQEYKGSVPADLAFLTMAHFQLGQKEQAAGALARLRERMKDPRWANDADSRAFLQEAEALLEGRAEQRKMPYAPP
jgi:hypothetical protein